MTTRRALEARATNIEAELLRRRTATQIQAEYALNNDNREPEVDERPLEELSTSERQVRSLKAPQIGRGGRGWQEVTS